MLHAIIMAGGSGTRFWPRSRRDRPKQLLRLAGESTMLQQTVARIEHLVPPERVFIITGADQAEATRAQLPDLPARNVVAEPCPARHGPVRGAGGRDRRHRRTPSGTMIVMPADHVIEPVEAFRTTVRAAVAVVDDDPSALVTFGINPTRPETGYGYIERGERCWRRATGSPSTGSSSSARSPTGRRPSGSWPPAISCGTRASSSGAPARSSMRSATHRPQLARGARADPASHWARRTRPRPWRGYFPQLERVPIDKAVMEHAPQRPGARGPVRLERRRRLAGAGHACSSATPPATPSRGTSSPATRPDSIIISDDGGLVATLGVDDLVVVHSGKATLVARKDQLDKLKALVEGLAKAGYGAHL